jgi:predicted porin
MKKSLIALAVLAASGAAMAQSSVTIYGTLDVGYGKLKGGLAGLNNTGYVTPISQSSTALANTFARSDLTTNNIGFRGVEDLGGGLNAFFNLQTGGLDLSTGSNALAFSRESNVGLTGGFGTFKMGRAVSTMCAAGCSYDYNYISNGSGFALVGLSAASIKASSRRSNQIEWTSPTMNGFTARVSTIMKGDAIEDSTFAVDSTNTKAVGRAIGLNYKAQNTFALNYANGPVRAVYVSEGAATDSTATRTATFAAAEYDFGMAKVLVTSTTNGNKGGNQPATQQLSGSSTAVNWIGTSALGRTDGATSGKGTGMAINVPVGAWNIGYQASKNTENQTKANEVFARYSLSKRTEIYSYMGKTSGVNAVAAGVFPSATLNPNVTTNTGATTGAIATNALVMGAVPANPTVTAVGIRHTF